MTKEIGFYMDGMISFGVLSTKDQIWVFVNHPQMVPAGAMLFCLSQ